MKTPETTVTAEKKNKTEFAGLGAAVQAIGLVVCFLIFPVGLVAGILLLVIGGRMAIVWGCSECRGKIDKAARRCPHCGAQFEER